MRLFSRILVANRGEIAIRVMKACHALGKETVGVYSDMDARSAHVRYADQSIRLGSIAASYLDAKRIIEAALETRAEAIHPGYGFLSENAEFADACADAGLVFIGPTPAAMRAMGLKSAARRIAVKVGIPVVPGYDGDDQNRDVLRSEILRIGMPILIKASAGGGGKGMRVIERREEIDDCLDAAQREALKSFGNGDVLLERLVENARHVEVQILGDHHGNIVSVFERDCSVQRRHQKVLEECPSPAVDVALRKRLGEMAVKISREIGYTNAGTVEFLLTPGGEFYFIEANTRLQVEHAVTEMVTGLDLVKLQIEIAEGHPLPFRQDDLKITGHAIEARLYAEDPDNAFLPAVGRVLDLNWPDGDVRVDTGTVAGDDVGIHFDPILAKVIAAAPDRVQAIRKLSQFLRRLSVSGVTTNRDFLVRVLSSEGFLAGDACTNFVDQNIGVLTEGASGHATRRFLIAAALFRQSRIRDSSPYFRTYSTGYRNNPYRLPSFRLSINGSEKDVAWTPKGIDGFEFEFDGTKTRARVIDVNQETYFVEIDGVAQSYRMIADGADIWVHSTSGDCRVTVVSRFPETDHAAAHGDAISPMPGQVLKVLVSVGQEVRVGEPLVILEAMKMEQTIKAGANGKVETILIKLGQVVSPGDLLVHIISSD